MILILWFILRIGGNSSGIGPMTSSNNSVHLIRWAINKSCVTDLSSRCDTSPMGDSIYISGSYIVGDSRLRDVGGSGLVDKIEALPEPQ